MIAGLSHYVSPDRLKNISASVPKVTIVTGDSDHLVRPQNSQVLKQHMPEAELVLWEGTGHALHAQWPTRYRDLLNKAFREGVEKGRNFH
jgi:pimeloyl-ACP methyl ester carboxylesterase